MNTHQNLEVFNSLAEHHGVRESLAYLLSLTDFRFIGVWQLQGGKARTAFYLDRDDQLVMHAEEVPETSTYCHWVRESKAPFVTANSPHDPRTIGHPARETVQSYFGVPILDDDGDVLGVLCHYDAAPRDLRQIDHALIIQAARSLARGGYVPPLVQ